MADRFPGFTEAGRTVPLPREFFSRLLNGIDDLVELKVTLYLFWRIHLTTAFPRLVTRRQVLADRIFVAGLGTPAEPARESLARGLRLATARGTFLQLRVKLPERSEAVFLVNTPANQKVAERIVVGEIWPEAVEVRPVDPEVDLDRPNIYQLYEQNIGVLTPLIADQLRDAEATFPPTWVEDAFREAVAQNRRSWRYILKILDRWASEGRSDGTTRRDPARSADQPASYWSGRFGHLIRH